MNAKDVINSLAFFVIDGDKNEMALEWLIDLVAQSIKIVLDSEIILRKTFDIVAHCTAKITNSKVNTEKSV